GVTSYTCTVTFLAPTGTNSGIDVGPIIGNDNAVRVTGPGGFDAPATFVSIDNPTNGAPRTATYTVTPPGGSWDMFDRGIYGINVQSNQVADLDGNYVPAGSYGVFTVFIPSYTVFNANDAGFGSLRQTIIDSLVNPGADTITFDPAFFNTPRTITLQSGLPQFTAAAGALTITGPGAALLTIKRDSAAPNFRIFDSATATLNISGLTATGGAAPTGGGGALRAVGTAPVVTLDGVVFSGSSTAREGGGIYIGAGGFLNLRNSTISGNTAGTDGGG